MVFKLRHVTITIYYDYYFAAKSLSNTCDIANLTLQAAIRCVFGSDETSLHVDRNREPSDVYITGITSVALVI